MILKMLGELPFDELSLHVDPIALSLESPQEKVVKWALETLLQIAPPNLDWPRVIETTGEELWSQNVGLAKNAAKFLGMVPPENTALAWEKLNAATALENNSLVETIFRAMTALKKKTTDLKSDSVTYERLKLLAQLSPDRFGKFAKKLGGE